MHHAPHRRSIRLKGFDYRWPGAYFVTICTFHKRCVFGAILESGVRLSPEGKVAQQAWVDIPKHFPHAEAGPFVIMPNHVHGIIILNALPAGRRGTACRAPTSFGRPVAGSLSTIVRSYKSAVTRTVHLRRPFSTPPLWQRGFYERVVRGEEDLRRIAEYLEENPRRWAEDEYFVDRG